MARWLFLLIVLLHAHLLTIRPLSAQESPTITPTVFRRYADRVVKIQVVESGSAAKAGVGSGHHTGH